jgi:DNA-binding NtrC family response regulator
MTIQKSLTNKERDFFHQVSAAAFSNPFSDARHGADQALAGICGSGREQALHGAISAVRQCLADLAREGRANLALYGREDRQLLLTTILFDQYHACLPQFDALIVEQIQAGEAPCAVPFSAQALAQLRDYGCTAQQARHYFAFFYQLRRGFFFINQLVGSSASMRTLRCRLWNNIFTHDTQRYEVTLWNRLEDFSTLLLGETGTGKGAAAAAIGRSGFIPFDEKSGRFAESFTRNFIAINLSQFPESLIESELFGHKKGAFTGAVDNHQGVFARCVPHGAIFLDEIGDVSVPVQIKLLQVLQERRFYPVGSHVAQSFRGRIIAATNRPLEELRRAGNFRDDFFYRLCSDVIEVPTLRKQLADDPDSLPGLLERLIVRIVGSEDTELAKTIHRQLQEDLPPNYSWPGNVRELEQAVRRLLLNGHYYGDPYAHADSGDNLQTLADSGTMDAQQLLSRYCRQLYDRFGTYEEVARRTRLDRRTVKKYIQGE